MQVGTVVIITIPICTGRNRDSRIFNNWLKVTQQVTEHGFEPRKSRSRICAVNLLLYGQAKNLRERGKLKTFNETL